MVSIHPIQINVDGQLKSPKHLSSVWGNFLQQPNLEYTRLPSPTRAYRSKSPLHLMTSSFPNLPPIYNLFWNEGLQSPSRTYESSYNNAFDNLINSVKSLKSSQLMVNKRYKLVNKATRNYQNEIKECYDLMEFIQNEQAEQRYHLRVYLDEKAILIQKIYRGYICRCHLLENCLYNAVVKIQSIIRTFSAKIYAKKMKLEKKAAIIIQRNVRGYFTRRAVVQLISAEKHISASRIQKIWKRAFYKLKAIKMIQIYKKMEISREIRQRFRQSAKKAYQFRHKLLALNNITNRMMLRRKSINIDNNPLSIRRSKEDFSTSLIKQRENEIQRAREMFILRQLSNSMSLASKKESKNSLLNYGQKIESKSNISLLQTDSLHK